MLDCPTGPHLRNPRQSVLVDTVRRLLLSRYKDMQQGRRRKRKLVHPGPPAHMTSRDVQGAQILELPASLQGDAGISAVTSQSGLVKQLLPDADL